MSSFRRYFGLKKLGPWWKRRDARETKTQISWALNLALLLVALPVGIHYVMDKKEEAVHKPHPSQTLALADENAATLALLNERRIAAGKKPLKELVDPENPRLVYEDPADVEESERLWEKVKEGLRRREKKSTKDAKEVRRAERV